MACCRFGIETVHDGNATLTLCKSKTKRDTDTTKPFSTKSTKRISKRNGAVKLMCFSCCVNNKGDFIGREALLKIKEKGIKRKLCCLTFGDPQAVALGKEPILGGDKKLGYVSSADYGYSVGKYIVYGYLPTEYTQEGTKVEVQYFDRRYTATVTTEPLYDPKGEKLKA